MPWMWYESARPNTAGVREGDNQARSYFLNLDGFTFAVYGQWANEWSSE